MLKLKNKRTWRTPKNLLAISKSISSRIIRWTMNTFWRIWTIEIPYLNRALSSWRDNQSVTYLHHNFQRSLPLEQESKGVKGWKMTRYHPTEKSQEGYSPCWMMASARRTSKKKITQRNRLIMSRQWCRNRNSSTIRTLTLVGSSTLKRQHNNQKIWKIWLGTWPTSATSWNPSRSSLVTP